MQGFSLCPFLEKSFLGRVLENCRFVDRKGGRPHIFANCAGVFFFPSQMEEVPARLWGQKLLSFAAPTVSLSFYPVRE